MSTKMKIFLIFSYLCVFTFAQDDLMAMNETTSTNGEDSNSFVDQLLKSLSVAAADDSKDDEQNSSTMIITTSTAPSVVNITTSTSATPTLSMTAKTSREPKARYQNRFTNANVLTDFIQKLASVPPETFDRIITLLNNSTSTTPTVEIPGRLGESETTELSTPMLYTSKIEDSSEDTENSQIADIISIISSAAAQEKTTQKQPENTTVEPVVKVYPLVTYQNSSAGSEIIFGPQVTSSTPSTVVIITPSTNATTENPTSTEVNGVDALNNRLANNEEAEPRPNTEDPLSPYKPDFFVFGVLPNGTVIRKRPLIINPAVVIGVLPNDTLIQKFPNGSIAPLPMDDVVQVNGFDTSETTKDRPYAPRSLDPATTEMPLIESRLSNDTFIATPEDVLQDRNDTNNTMNPVEMESILTSAQMQTTTPLMSTAEPTTPEASLNSIDENTLVNPLGLLLQDGMPSSPVTLMELLTNNVTSIATSVSKSVVESMTLTEKQKQDLSIIETLLKRQQVVLEHLALITKMNLETKPSQARGNLTERVMAKVMESMKMSTTTTATTTMVSKNPSTEAPKVSTKKYKAKQVLITEKQIELLINQLEAIKKNPEKVKKLDIDALRKLQKFENSVQNAGDAASVMGMIKMDVMDKLENRFGSAPTTTTVPTTTAVPTTTTVPTTTAVPTTAAVPTTTTVSTTMMSTTMDPQMRKEFVNYAVNISQAISSFLGSALQEATQKFVQSLVNSKDILKLDGLEGIKNSTSM